jgi:hypothetical protein
LVDAHGIEFEIDIEVEFADYGKFFVEMCLLVSVLRCLFLLFASDIKVFRP